MNQPHWTELSHSECSNIVRSLDASSRRPPERNFDLSEAFDRIVQCLDPHQIKVYAVAITGGFTAAVAIISDTVSPSKTAVRGAGKGLIGDAVTGALAELAEHFFSGPDMDLDDADLRWGDGAALSDVAQYEPSIARIFAGSPSANLLCGAFRPIGLSDKSASSADVLIPVYLWAPWYGGIDVESSRIRRLVGDGTDYSAGVTSSVNSGCAFGCSEAEATLHALNELIERDALSIAMRRLLRHLSGSADSAVLAAIRRVDLASAVEDPDELLGPMHSPSTDCANFSVYLFDITSDVGIPVFLAVRKCLCGIGEAHTRFGMGCSLSRGYAARRAVSELMQSAILSQDDGIKELSAYARRSLLNYPLLARVANFEFPSCVLNSIHSFSGDSEDMTKGMAVVDQIEASVDKVRRAGFVPLSRVIRSFDNGCSVVQCQVPGFDRFNHVLDGRLAVPVPARF